MFLAVALTASCVGAQNTQQPPNVSQVVLWSTLVTAPNSPARIGQATPLLSVYTLQTSVDFTDKLAFNNAINNPTGYQVANTAALSSAVSTNIAVALSLIPLSSPTSATILKKDPATGAELPASRSLGPIFTQRAETIGKGKVYIGFTHQDYHFTSLNGTSLNGLPVLYGGGDLSGITNAGSATTTRPATLNMGLDVRLSQDLTFITYGVTNGFDVSVGLPVVHAAVASTAYNGIVYSGTGKGFSAESQCWCVNTFVPGVEQLTTSTIGQAALSKTGFGDMVLRFKDGVLTRPRASLAVGADLRLPTGDEANFLGTGTTSIRPFMALSLYTRPLANNIVFAPHLDVGWQFSGKSILGGTLQATLQPAQTDSGETVQVAGPQNGQFNTTKDYLPDIFQWAAGTEVAFGRSTTAVIDFFGNQIGWIHGAPLLNSQSIGFPPLSGVTPLNAAFAGVGRGSFGQYNGAFGVKQRIKGNLVATFQMLVRFDNNGLVARYTPLYGLGYSFGE